MVEGAHLRVSQQEGDFIELDVANRRLHLDIPEAELAAHGISPIDLVVVNLYPFEATVAKPGVSLHDAIENIDIGGVTLIRAAAKNHERVTLICDPADYNSVLAEIRAGGISAQTRTKLAVKGFASSVYSWNLRRFSLGVWFNLGPFLHE